MTKNSWQLSKSADHLLAELAGQKRVAKPGGKAGARSNAKSSRQIPARRLLAQADQDIAALIAADLVARDPGGALEVTNTGLAHLARSAHARATDTHSADASANAQIDPFRAQHLDLAQRTIGIGGGLATIDEAESPLAWLARRKGPDGRAHIAPVQLQAGERLRAEFTRAQLMPRTTSSWSAAVADGRRGAGPHAHITETVVAARQRLRQALDAIGPEFSGLLLDVCCFLKGLVDVERERGWPPRSAKVVLQLGLDRLARHYGLAEETRGRSRAPTRTWLAPGAKFIVE